MLGIDTTGLSVRELEEIVADRCSSFGIVRKVAVFVSREGLPVRPFALIYMRTPEEAKHLANAFSRNAIGLVVIIPLGPPDRAFAFRPGAQPPVAGGMTVSK